MKVFYRSHWRVGFGIGMPMAFAVLLGASYVAETDWLPRHLMGGTTDPLNLAPALAPQLFLLVAQNGILLYPGTHAVRLLGLMQAGAGGWIVAAAGHVSVSGPLELAYQLPPLASDTERNVLALTMVAICGRMAATSVIAGGLALRAAVAEVVKVSTWVVAVANLVPTTSALMFLGGASIACGLFETFHAPRQMGKARRRRHRQTARHS